MYLRGCRRIVNSILALRKYLSIGGSIFILPSGPSLNRSVLGFAIYVLVANGFCNSVVMHLFLLGMRSRALLGYLPLKNFISSTYESSFYSIENQMVTCF